MPRPQRCKGLRRLPVTRRGPTPSTKLCRTGWHGARGPSCRRARASAGKTSPTPPRRACCASSSPREPRPRRHSPPTISAPFLAGFAHLPSSDPSTLLTRRQPRRRQRAAAVRRASSWFLRTQRDDTLNVVRVAQADVEGTEPPACVRGLRGPALRCGLWVGPEAADDCKASILQSHRKAEVCNGTATPEKVGISPTMGHTLALGPSRGRLATPSTFGPWALAWSGVRGCRVRSAWRVGAGRVSPTGAIRGKMIR